MESSVESEESIWVVDSEFPLSQEGVIRSKASGGPHLPSHFEEEILSALEVWIRETSHDCFDPITIVEGTLLRLMYVDRNLNAKKLHLRSQQVLKPQMVRDLVIVKE